MKIQPSLRSGSNRTGLGVAADYLRRGMLDVPRELMGPTSRGSREELARVRVRYAREGFTHGTMPPMARAQRRLLQLFDLLGARLAYERAGTRFYDALGSKVDAYGSFDGGPDHHDLEELRGEELAHVRMLERVITELGGDATVVTPSANLQLIASRGLGDVLTDPRTSVVDGLGALVVAELAHHEEWLGLIEVARELQLDDLVPSFQSAQLTEELHLSKVRRWLAFGRHAARRQIANGA